MVGIEEYHPLPEPHHAPFLASGVFRIQERGRHRLAQGITRVLPVFCANSLSQVRASSRQEQVRGCRGVKPRVLEGDSVLREVKRVLAKPLSVRPPTALQPFLPRELQQSAD
eukprot:CAMPEP_0167772190 /NCGR_PEP_ID=MMETSP0111_2-20121227/707_1 /TAXON_ID=91324 /ORGANISM="Lotharella globosa, Strain CCCM811" /LENGTH=111 /DNA_ID=CAMNT_0007661649 /DNA_START=626 /DNA_END=961 /DNA_ORIENTATION=+